MSRQITVVLDQETIDRLAAVRSTLSPEDAVASMLKLGLLNAESRKRRDADVKLALAQFRAAQKS